MHTNFKIFLRLHCANFDVKNVYSFFAVEPVLKKKSEVEEELKRRYHKKEACKK